jgi:hypothetical protein
MVNLMKKYYKDYRLINKTLPNGKTKQVAEYIGEYYICQLSDRNFKLYKLYLFALAICSSAIVIGAGVINNSGSRMAYVALPYVLLYLPTVFILMSVIVFALSGKKLEQAAYDKIKIRMYRSTIWNIALSSIACIGNIVFTLYMSEKMSKGILVSNWLFTGSMIILLGISLFFLQFQKRVIYQVEDPNYNELL